MGLFFNYSKPGPGIDKNAPKKKGIFLYFELYFRKFWKMIQANLLYFICSIPMLLIYMAFFMFFVVPYMTDVIGVLSGGDAEAQAIYMLMFTVLFSIITLILWGSGPASAGYAYLMRCFAREEHAWIMSDFKDKFKENFKQAIVVSIVDIVILFVSTTAIRFYVGSYQNTHSTLYLMLASLVVIVFVLYTFMHYYIYQLMVTFENSLSQLYRNSAILAIGFLPMNIILTLISVGATLVAYTTLHPLFGLVVAAVIWVSAFRFPFDFYSARTIRRRLIPEEPETETIESIVEDDAE